MSSSAYEEALLSLSYGDVKGLCNTKQQFDNKWLYETTQCLAQTNNLPCLESAIEHGCVWHHATMDTAAKNGSLACMTFAYKHGCPWGFSTVGLALRYSHIECATFAFEHGAPFSNTSCIDAIASGSMDVLEWYRDNVPDAPVWTTYAGMSSIFLPTTTPTLLRWLCKEGCVFGSMELIQSCHHNSLPIFHVILEHMLQKSPTMHPTIYQQLDERAHLLDIHNYSVQQFLTYAEQYGWCRRFPKLHALYRRRTKWITGVCHCLSSYFPSDILTFVMTPYL